MEDLNVISRIGGRKKHQGGEAEAAHRVYLQGGGADIGENFNIIYQKVKQAFRNISSLDIMIILCKIVQRSHCILGRMYCKCPIEFP